ncbi:hypothetical protein M408DRAFT_115266 [Serendipita vermifera MAFF 305830]|uniref:RRM domain-containing protein n=1 Tax=Serendipita vermifera MAFF 305830 TaxID=933852 RepID=A0A0C3AYD6_SERVB|nr:hypothetical protein M408DRAFT_115266 [Serendipita vermifera MAFF 305830]
MNNSDSRQLISSATSLVDTSPQAQSAIQQAESLLREDKQESTSLQYPSQSFWGSGAFAGLQSPPQQTSLRHRQSSSNDALRAFGNMNGPIADAVPKQPFPQELYSSSSTSTDPSSFPRNVSAPEFDYSAGQRVVNGTGVPLGSASSRPPAPNAFGTVPQASSLSYSYPHLSNGSGPLPGSIQTTGFMPPSSLSMLSPQSSTGPQVPNGLLPQLPPMGQMLPTPSLPGPTSAAQLVQLLQGMSPDKKSAVIERLQGMTMQTLPPPQSLPPPAAQPVSQPQQQSQGGALSQEDISTIFVVGFPDDITEREFQNMFTFCPGYEAATLKVPPKELSSQTVPNPVVAAAASALAGANDPYNLVTMNSGGVVVDQGNNTAATTSSSWVTGLEDPYTRQALTAAALASSGVSTGELAQQLAMAQQAQPRKQIIGFAKFKSREEALHARDVLHGRRVDIEKGALLKAEMAKKNLHTKRGVGPAQGAGATGGNGNGNGPSSYGENGVGPTANEPSPPIQNMLQEQEKGLMGSLASLNLGNGLSANDPSVNAQAPLPSHLSRQSDSPTFKQPRFDEGYLLNSGPPTANGSFANDQTAFSAFPRNAFASQTNVNPHIASGQLEGFHPLPSKPVSDVIKANALPPTNLPPPIITSNLGQRNAFNKEASPPSMQQQEADAGYMSDALSSRMSERSRSVSVSRYGGYTPPLPHEEEANVHLPAHLLQDDVLGTPQQTDYGPNIFNATDYTNAGGAPATRTPQRKMTDASATVFSPTTEVPVGSSASSAAGSVSSGGAESMSISTTSGIGPSDFARQRQGTMSSVKTTSGGGNSDPQTRTSGEHHRGRPNAADQNPPINTLYVGNLPTNISTPQQIKFLEDSLQQLFSRCPGFVKLALRQKNNGPMCFFDDVPNASKALNDMYGNTLNGLVKGGGIRLSYSKNPLGNTFL